MCQVKSEGLKISSTIDPRALLVAIPPGAEMSDPIWIICPAFAWIVTVDDVSIYIMMVLPISNPAVTGNVAVNAALQK